MQMIKPNKDQDQRLVQKTNMNRNQKLQKVGDSSTNIPGNSFGTEVISPEEGGSDDNSDGSQVLQSNPPLSGKALLYQQYLESKQNDTTMNVPGDNVVTDVIPPGGSESQYKSDEPTVFPSNSPLCGKTLLYQQYLEKEKGGKYKTGKLASSITSQCLYHDVFTMYLRHFLPDDLYFLKYTIQPIITNSTSPPNRCTMTPVAEVNLVVDSWTTTPKATTPGSSLGFEDNVCEATLSSQSPYKINSGCPYYKASIASNPKLLNDFEPSKEQLETVYGGIKEEVNELRLQIASKKILSAIDYQGKTINTNIAKVQAQNVVFWLLDDNELVYWTTTNFLFERLRCCENIHHSSILKLAIEEAFQKSTNENLSSKLFQDDSNYEKNQFCVFTQKGHLVDILPYS
jgi:hypothetical protein